MVGTQIEVRDLTKIYATGKKANDCVNLHVNEGEIVGVIGPNGAGKTTLIRQLLGLLKPTAGSILLGGQDVIRHPTMISQMVGYVPQLPLRFPSLTVEETIKYVLRMRGHKGADLNQRVGKALETSGLTAMAHVMGYQLSAGMAKLLLFAMAYCQDTPVLILDEPTSMVDIANKMRIWRALSSENQKTVLLASHDLTEVRHLCHRAYIMVNGRVAVQGTPQEISASLDLPVEARFIPNDMQATETILLSRGTRYSKSAALITAEFSSLKECLDTLHSLADEVGLSYVSFEGPSFEKAVVHLMEVKAQ